MLKNIQYLKDNFSFKKIFTNGIISTSNLKYLALLFAIWIINVHIEHFYENKKPDLALLQSTHDKTMLLKNNVIVKKHNLNSNSENFIRYIEQCLDYKQTRIPDIKVGEFEKFSNVRMIPIEIDCTFIHDKFIFELIDKIHQYDGFIRTVAVRINKRRLDNGRHVLKAIIVCALYTK